MKDAEYISSGILTVSLDMSASGWMTFLLPCTSLFLAI